MAAAPRLLGPVEGDFQLSARVRCTFAGAFDAGALLLWAGEHRWVKLAFEVSPQGEPMVVSVVTDGRSDDANAFAVEDDAVCLRVSRLGQACALHARLDGEAWRFVRHFPLQATDGLRAGFLVQSPTGDGATARFDEIDFCRGAPGGPAIWGIAGESGVGAGQSSWAVPTAKSARKNLAQCLPCAARRTPKAISALAVMRSMRALTRGLRRALPTRPTRLMSPLNQAR